MALKKYALDPAEREKECTHEMGFPLRGTVPNTGPRICRMCGTNREDTICTRCPEPLGQAFFVEPITGRRYHCYHDDY